MTRRLDAENMQASFTARVRLVAWIVVAVLSVSGVCSGIVVWRGIDKRRRVAVPDGTAGAELAEIMRRRWEKLWPVVSLILQG